MQKNIHEDMQDKQRSRSLIYMLYKIQHWAFMLCVCGVGMLFMILLICLIAIKTSWGAMLLSDAVPWPWIFAGALVLGFLFIFTDTFIQSREEHWFRRYGTQIMATVTDFEEVRTSQWRRWFSLNDSEYRLKLEWTNPQNEMVHSYLRRVRDMQLPTRGAQVPVIIDFDDPAYFLQEDFKRPY
jgi:uncharacterized membrane protein (DUF485 family)